jgi:NAD(P)H dehydrogenase (quinone)
MILVTGASGHLGRAAIESLLAKQVDPAHIAALVRDKAKAADLAAKGVQLREGDYSDTASLEKAFAGVNKLLLVSSSDVQGDRYLQHKAVIDAAKAAGVQHIAYTSINSNDRGNTRIPFIIDAHVQTEAYLQQAGVAYTILQNNLYADLIPAFLGHQVLETGIYFPAGEGRVAFALRTDMAAAAAAVFTTAGHENKTYAIAGNEAISFSDIAQMLSRISGKEIVYHHATPEDYVAELGKTGLPAEVAGFFASFAAAAVQNEFDTNNTDLETLLGRAPVSVEAFLAGVYGK